MKRPERLQKEIGPSQKLITGFLGVSSFLFSVFWGGMSAEFCQLFYFFIFPSYPIALALGVPVSDVRFVWTGSDMKQRCRGRGCHVSVPLLNMPSPPRHRKTRQNRCCSGPRREVGQPCNVQTTQQSNLTFITYFSCKYFHTVSNLGLFLLFRFINPSRVMWYGLHKYRNEGDTPLSPSSGKSPFLLTGFQHHIYALLFFPLCNI